VYHLRLGYVLPGLQVEQRIALKERQGQCFLERMGEFGNSLKTLPLNMIQRKPAPGADSAG
jgi:hypothetical protein